MKSNILRTLTALMISFTGVFLSYYFLYPNQDVKKTNTKIAAMAKVLSAINDVKKQSAGKLLWEPVRKGDLLYLGERLRTSAFSNSKIEFIDNGASIDIEPDSLIIVNKNNQKLSLQVVEGSLFVSSKQDISNLSVTSGEKAENQINIKNGDVAYSVSKEGKANVDIIKGKIESSDSLINRGSEKFKDVKPLFGESILVDTKLNEDTLFHWMPLSSDYNVSMEFGANRNSMKKREDIIVDNANGNIKFKPILGTYFWKLTAQNNKNPIDQFSSNTFKVTFSQKMPPMPLFPIANDSVQLKSADDSIEFKWGIMHSFELVQLEVYNENNKSTPILSEQVTTQTFFSTNKISKAGKYFWKLNGKMNGSDSLLVSPLQHFQISIGEELQSPVPVSPEDHSTIYYTDKKDKAIHNLPLIWRSVKEAAQYLLIITNSDGVKKEFKLNSTEFIIPNLQNGVYTWIVQAIDSKKEMSKSNMHRTFTIEPMGEIAFKEMPNKVYYTNQFPTFNFSWTLKNNAESYRLKISQTQNFSNSEFINVKTNSFNYQIGKEGIYFAQVEALNKLETSMAHSEVFVFTVSKPQRPTPPIFLDTKKNLEASANGDISFELINYDNKFKVMYEIRDNKGNLIEQSKQNSKIVMFKSLIPGVLNITAKYIDEYNQTSESSDRKIFTVPEKSAIAAPKVKGVKIR